MDIFFSKIYKGLIFIPLFLLPTIASADAGPLMAGLAVLLGILVYAFFLFILFILIYVLLKFIKKYLVQNIFLLSFLLATAVLLINYILTDKNFFSSFFDWYIYSAIVLFGVVIGVSLLIIKFVLEKKTPIAIRAFYTVMFLSVLVIGWLGITIAISSDASTEFQCAVVVVPTERANCYMKLYPKIMKDVSDKRYCDKIERYGVLYKNRCLLNLSNTIPDTSVSSVCGEIKIRNTEQISDYYGQFRRRSLCYENTCGSEGMSRTCENIFYTTKNDCMVRSSDKDFCLLNLASKISNNPSDCTGIENEAIRWNCVVETASSLEESGELKARHAEACSSLEGAENEKSMYKCYNSILKTLMRVDNSEASKLCTILDRNGVIQLGVNGTMKQRETKYSLRRSKGYLYNNCLKIKNKISFLGTGEKAQNCKDSDGGLMYFKKGTTSTQKRCVEYSRESEKFEIVQCQSNSANYSQLCLYYDDFKNFSNKKPKLEIIGCRVAQEVKEDFCPVYNEKGVVEYYCDDEGYRQRKDQPCEYGCSDGACNIKP